MAFEKLTADLAIHQKLDDEPNDVGGLTAPVLKAKFDEAGLTIQDYINNTLLPELENAGGSYATKTEAQGYVNAHDISDTAHTDIRTAVSNAQSVANTANQAAALAHSTANTALSTANTALANANGAQSAANMAQITADAAGQAAAAAQTAVSNEAQDRAAADEAHVSTAIQSAGGVHGLRYQNDSFQLWDGGAWVVVDTGGGDTSEPPADIPTMGITQGNGELTIAWNDPDDTIDGGTVTVRWKGTKLIRKAGGYPESITDGVQVVDNQTRNAYANAGFVDSGLTNGTTYYYQLFPYSDTGAINTNAANRLSGAPLGFRVFGVSIDMANSNPETAVIYTNDAAGMTPGAAWDSMPIFKDIKPCVLKNGVVQYYLNLDNFALKADGTAADIISGNDGDVMIEIPKTGVAISAVGDTLTVKVTDNPNDPDFKYYAHTRAIEGDRDKLYFGAYLGYELNSSLRSLSGKTPTGAKTIGTFRALAQANGAGYDVVSFYPLTLLQCLYLIKFKNRDSQTALGRGYVDGNSAAAVTGGTNAKGMNFGETTGKLQMKFIGIEDFWGNLLCLIDGLYSNASWNILTAFQAFNDSGNGYANRGQVVTTNTLGYLRKPQGTSEAGFVYKEGTGSATTYFADTFSLKSTSVPFFGGGYNAAAGAGAFSLGIENNVASSSPIIGARLMYL